MKKPHVHSSTLVYRGFFDLQEDLVERRDGVLHPYASLILSTDATATLGQDREGHWVLNREYRHPTGEFLLGCPGGRLEKGEDPQEGALREFHEETGYWSDEMVLLGSSHPFPGLCNQKIYYFWAKNAFKKGPPSLDPFERIQTELKTDQALREEILHSTKVDSILCTTLWYQENYLRASQGKEGTTRCPPAAHRPESRP